MPATTPIYGLPYQVGTDPPCFGPGTDCDTLESVWCEFAAIVEEQLDQNDAVMGRTSTASPLAEIAFLGNTNLGLFLNPTDVNTTYNGYIPFDVVVADTDNIVTNFPVFTQVPDPVILALAPRRDGIYQVETSIRFNQGTTAEVPGLFIETGVALGAIGSDFPISFSSSRAAPFHLTDVRASQVFQFSSITGPFPRTIRTRLAGLWTNDTQILSARLAVYWHSDL